MTGAKGTLAGPLSAERIVVDHEAAHIDVRGLSVVSRPRALLIGPRRRSSSSSFASIDGATEGAARAAAVRAALPASRASAFTRRRSAIGNVGLTLQGRTAHPGAQATRLARAHALAPRPRSARRARPGRPGRAAHWRCARPSRWDCARTCVASGNCPAGRLQYAFARRRRSGNLDRLDANLQLDAPAQLAFRRHAARPDRTAARQGTFRADGFRRLALGAGGSVSATERIDHARGGHRVARAWTAR